MGDQLVASPLPKHRTTQTPKNADTHQTSMPKAGFEHAITASELTKTVHESDSDRRIISTASKIMLKSQKGAIVNKRTNEVLLRKCTCKHVRIVKQASRL
jgi:ribosomal protein L15